MTANDWLPGLLEACSDLDALLANAEQQFKQDFVGCDPVVIDGLPVYQLRRKDQDGVDGDVWHIVSSDLSGGGEQSRTAKSERARHIGWIRKVLEAEPPQVVRWKKPTDTKRALIALPNFSYVVVLGKRRTSWRLVSGYPVRSGERKSLREQHRKAAHRGLTF